MYLIEKACGKGLYGLNCNQTCGDCRGSNQCSYINGECSAGCIAGFQGKICKTGKHFLSSTLMHHP